MFTNDLKTLKTAVTLITCCNAIAYGRCFISAISGNYTIPESLVLIAIGTINGIMIKLLLDLRDAIALELENRIRLRNKMRRSRYVEEYCFRKNRESD